MMAENKNLDIWQRLEKTDPKHTQKFKRAGGFSGTAIKPIYTVKKMTEEFGPAGYGWGMGEPMFQVVPGHNGEVLVYCTVNLWYAAKDNEGQRLINTVYGVGGDRVVSHIKANEQYKRPERWENDDEAFKKAFTDAIGNAMKHLGMSADVHMGLFDDSKYVREREAEEAGEAAVEPAPRPNPAQKSAYASKDAYVALRDEIKACFTVEELELLWKSPKFQEDYKTLPTSHQGLMIEQLKEHKAAIVAEMIRRTAPGYVAPTFEREPGSNG